MSTWWKRLLEKNFSSKVKLVIYSALQTSKLFCMTHMQSSHFTGMISLFLSFTSYNLHVTPWHLIVTGLPTSFCWPPQVSLEEIVTRNIYHILIVWCRTSVDMKFTFSFKFHLSVADHRKILQSEGAHPTLQAICCPVLLQHSQVLCSGAQRLYQDNATWTGEWRSNHYC